MPADFLLLDTGPLVSLLDRRQRHHGRCVEVFNAWRGELVTTEAVITEATRLLGRMDGGVATCLDFITSGGARVVPATMRSLTRARELVVKYADIPMDYADATLVVLAEDLSTDDIFTLDRSGFETFRIGGRRRFSILPA